MSEPIIHEEKRLNGHFIWKDYILEVWKKDLQPTQRMTITIDGEIWKSYDVIHGAFVRVTVEDKSTIKRTDLETKKFELEQTIAELEKEKVIP